MGNEDGPSAKRMGFGYKEAKDSGVPYIAPRSAKQINDETRERAVVRKLRQLIADDVNYGPRINQLRKQGKTAQEILQELAPDSALNRK